MFVWNKNKKLMNDYQKKKQIKNQLNSLSLWYNLWAANPPLDLKVLGQTWHLKLRTRLCTTATCSFNLELLMKPFPHWLQGCGVNLRCLFLMWSCMNPVFLNLVVQSGYVQEIRHSVKCCSLLWLIIACRIVNLRSQRSHGKSKIPTCFLKQNQCLLL